MSTDGIQAPFLMGFESLTSEHDHLTLPYRGEPLPAWLSGVYLRNGPALFEFPPHGPKFRHFFDGLAMLQIFRFQAGQTIYSNRFLASDDYRQSTARGRPCFTEFGTAPTRSWWQKIKATVQPSTQFGDNNSVNLVELDGQVVAISDYPVPLAIDPASGQTRGRYRYQDRLSSLINSPHPLWDKDRKEQVNFGVKISPSGCRYTLFRIADGTRRREPITEVNVAKPAYMHSFALTDRYIILTEHPVPVSIIDLATMALRGKSLVDAFRWRPDRPTRFIVVERSGGRHVGVFETDPFFLYHHCNAFEHDGRIVIDLCRYQNFGPVESLYFRNLRGPAGARVAPSLPYRYTIDPVGGNLDVRRLSDQVLELPMINFGYSRRDYRFVYGESAAPGEPADFYDRLIKLDVSSGGTLVWHRPGFYVGEPRFIARPGAAAEDDGVVLAIVLNSNTRRSELLILDGASFSEIGRAEIPHVVPYGLHSYYA